MYLLTLLSYLLTYLLTAAPLMLSSCSSTFIFLFESQQSLFSPCLTSSPRTFQPVNDESLSLSPHLSLTISLSANFVRSLNARHPKCCKSGSARSVGQRSRLQRDITYQYQKRKVSRSGTDRLSKVKLGENYPRAERIT